MRNQSYQRAIIACLNRRTFLSFSGARMSASLPFLLSAVPLYAVHITHDDKFSLKCCWFSDGGLASGLPLHFFDAPIPSRPTFAINLVPGYGEEAVEVDEIAGKLTVCPYSESAEPQTNRPKGSDKVWMPTKNTTSVDRLNACTRVGRFY